MPRIHPFLLRSADANAARLPRLCSQAGVRCMRSFHNTIYMSSRCVFFLRAASAAMPRVHPFLLRSADANATRLPRLRSQAGVRCMRSFHNTRYMSSRCVFSCVPQARRCRGYTLFYFARRMQMLRACPAFACKRVEWFLGGFPLRLFLACRKRGGAAGTPFFTSLGGCKCYALAPPPLASGCALHEVISQHKIHEFPLRFFLRSGCEFEGRLRIWGRVAGKNSKNILTPCQNGASISLLTRCQDV